jgi:hypothetical protein
MNDKVSRNHYDCATDAVRETLFKYGDNEAAFNRCVTYTEQLEARVWVLEKALEFYAKHCPQDSLNGPDGFPTAIKAKAALAGKDKA